MPTQGRTTIFLSTLVLCGISLLGLTACGGDSGPNPGSLTIVTSSLPGGAVNQPYSASLTPSGGTPPYTWSVAPPLPNGLVLDPATGTITGTPTIEGTTAHTFSLQDNSVPAQTVKETLSLAIAPPAGTLTITTTSLPNGTVGVPYSRPVQATGGSGTLTWTISAGALPAGLTLDPATGLISGTPTAPGTSSFTVRAADTGGQSDEQPLSITITVIPPPGTPPDITTTSLPAGTVNQVYNHPVDATGGTGALTWSIFAGALPAGLTLNSTNGEISGTPTVVGTSFFTVRVQDAAGLSDFQALSITIDPPAPPRITTTSLPSGRIGRPYSEGVQATGGTGARIWTIVEGTLPAGLTLDPATGLISGTPTVEDTFSFTVRVEDAAGGSDQEALSIRIRSEGGGGNNDD